MLGGPVTFGGSKTELSALSLSGDCAAALSTGGRVLGVRSLELSGAATLDLTDGGLVVDDGVITARADFATMRAGHPQAEVVDLSGGVLLPWLVDAHVHFPQVRAIGALGMPLLEWLERCALPEELRLA